MSRLEFKFRPDALPQVKAAVFESYQRTFDEDVVPEAKRLSPVTPEGLARNTAMGKKRPGGTGDNRRSIDSTTEDTPEGPRSELFTQSGHGAYLELGTSKMRAQPYLYPAWASKAVQGVVSRLTEAIRRIG